MPESTWGPTAYVVAIKTLSGRELNDCGAKMAGAKFALTALAGLFRKRYAPLLILTLHRRAR